MYQNLQKESLVKRNDQLIKTIIMKNNFELLNAFGGQSINQSDSNKIVYYSTQNDKVVYFVGKQIVIENIQREEILQDMSYEQAIDKSDQNFFQFSSSILKSLEYFKDTKFKDFQYDRKKKIMLINVELFDDETKVYPKVLICDFGNQETNSAFFKDLKGDQFEKVQYIPKLNQFIGLTNKKPQQIILYDIKKMQTQEHSFFHKSYNIKNFSFSPNNTNKIFGFSNQSKKIKVIKINDNQYNEEIALSLKLNKGILDMIWLNDEYLVIVDSKGFNLLLIQYINQKFIIVQKIDQFSFTKEEKTINFNDINIKLVKIFNKGIFVVMENEITLVLMQNKYYVDYNNKQLSKNEENILTPFSCFKLKDIKDQITSLDFSEKYKKILIGLNTGQYIDLSMILILKKTNTSHIQKRLGTINLDQIITKISYKPPKDIDQVDICKNQPLVLFLSIKTSEITLYNYISKKVILQNRILNQTDQEGILFTKISPTGYSFIACFNDNIAVYDILFNKFILKAVNNKIKESYFCQYSSQGSYIAICYNQNKTHNNTLSLFNSNNLELLKILSNKVQTINDIMWNNLDTQLYCCTQDGILNHWDLSDYNKRDIMKNPHLKLQQIQKLKQGNEFQFLLLAEDIYETQYLCIQKNPNSEAFQKIKINTVTKHNSSKITYFSYVQNQKGFNGLVLGNSKGDLFFYSDIFNLENFKKIQTLIDSQIINLKIINFLNVLLVFGRQGSISIYKQQVEKQKTNSNQQIDLAQQELKKYKELTLVKKSFLDSQEQREKQYLQEIQDLVNKMEVKISEDQRIYQQNLDHIKNQYTLELENQNIELKKVKRQKELIEQQTSFIIKNIEQKHLEAVENLEKVFEQKLLNENTKLLDMEKNYFQEKIVNKEQLQGIECENKQMFDNIKNDLKTELKNFDQKLGNHEQEKKQIIQNYEEEQKKQQDEHDLIVAQLKKNFIEQIKSGKQQVISLKADIEKHKRQNIQFSQDMDKLNRDILLQKNQLELLNDKLQTQQKLLDKKNQELKKCVSQIQDKDLQIYELKTNIETLEKNKNYLQFQADEIQKGIEPKDIQIKKLKEQNNILESELNRCLKKIQEKDVMLGKQKDQLKSNHIQINQISKIVAEKNLFCNKICTIIKNCIHSIDPQYWYIEMKKLHNFINMNSSNFQQQNQYQDKVEQKFQEMGNQIHFLQQRISQSNKEKFKINFYKKKHIEAKTEENTLLINELNKLRMDRKNLMDLKNQLEMENRLLKNQAHNGVNKRLKRPSDVAPINKQSDKKIQPNFQKYALDLQTKKKISKNLALIIKDLVMNRRNIDYNLKKISDETKNQIIKKMLKKQANKQLKQNLIMKLIKSLQKIRMLQFSTTQQLKELRSLSGAPLIKCKEALQKKTDLQEALKYLKENNLIMAEKHSKRAQNEGVLVYTENQNKFQVLKIKTETDFVSSNREFLNFARISGDYALNQQTLQDGKHELNDHNIQSLSQQKDLLYEQKQITAKIQENIKITDLFQRTLKDNEIVGCYVHDKLDKNIGTKLSYVVIECNCKPQTQQAQSLKAFSNDLSVHILCNQPLYISEQDVPIEERNRIIFEIKEQLKDDKKPDNIKEKIIAGKYNKILKEDVLLQQDIYYIDSKGNDSKIPVEQCIKQVQKDTNMKFKIKEFDILKLKQLIFNK